MSVITPLRLTHRIAIVRWLLPQAIVLWGHQQEALDDDEGPGGFDWGDMDDWGDWQQRGQHEWHGGAEVSEAEDEHLQFADQREIVKRCKNVVSVLRYLVGYDNNMCTAGGSLGCLLSQCALARQHGSSGVHTGRLRFPHPNTVFQSGIHSAWTLVVGALLCAHLSPA